MEHVQVEKKEYVIPPLALASLSMAEEVSPTLLGRPVATIADNWSSKKEKAAGSGKKSRRQFRFEQEAEARQSDAATAFSSKQPAASSQQLAAKQPEKCREQPAASSQQPATKQPEKCRQQPAESRADAAAEEEKSRLHELVHVFAKEAYRGIPCTYLDVGAGTRATTTYQINRALTQLMVMSPEKPNSPKVTCPIASIRDVYSMEEDGEAAFPRELLRMLRPGEAERLLMFVCQAEKDQWLKVCILEESLKSKTALLECLRVLCIYTAAAPARDPAVKGATVPKAVAVFGGA